MDNINPDHYAKSCSLECIESMELIFGEEVVYNFCICNTWKYLWRWKNKNGLEDLQKAEWYANRAWNYPMANLELVDRLRDFITNKINDAFEEMEEQHEE